MLQVEIESQAVKTSSCECPNGKHQCHHIAALLVWVEKNVARTDIECSWSKPKQPASASAKCVSSLWPRESHGKTNMFQ